MSDALPMIVGALTISTSVVVMMMLAQQTLTKIPPPPGHPRFKIFRDTKYALPPTA